VAKLDLAIDRRGIKTIASHDIACTMMVSRGLFRLFGMTVVVCLMLGEITPPLTRLACLFCALYMLFAHALA
jgi:hypothetical protein